MEQFSPHDVIDSAKIALVFGMGAGILLFACGGSRANDEKPATPAIISPAPEYEMSKMPEPSTAAPTASEVGTAPAPPTPPAKKPKRSGMQPVFANDDGVSTIVGTQGAVFKVAGATLRVPEDALRDGKDIRLAPSRTPLAKGEPVRLGGAFDVGPVLTSAGPPFELLLPVPVDAGELVLVTISRSTTKDGKANTAISTIAPTSVDAGKREALFELTELRDGTVYLAKKSALPTPSPEPTAVPATAPPATSANAPPKH
jgi:hypothetical protein